jgi:hypothetical protein
MKFVVANCLIKPIGFVRNGPQEERNAPPDTTRGAICADCALDFLSSHQTNLIILPRVELLTVEALQVFCPARRKETLRRAVC